MISKMAKWFDSKAVCTLDQFKNISREKKILNDIALSGDGEPTSYVRFTDVCKGLYELQKKSVFNFKLILITNGSMLHKKGIAQGVDYLLKKKRPTLGET